MVDDNSFDQVKEEIDQSTSIEFYTMNWLNLKIKHRISVMNRFSLLTLIFSLVLFSCSKDKAKEDELFNQVMEIHDEVMPEMGSLMKLTKQLKVELDSVMSLEKTDSEQQRIIKITELISGLESANDLMMDWMRSFEPMEEGTSHGEVMGFLMEEKKKIEKVKQDMNDAKSRAEQYFVENQ